jgi:hypothetical protein
MKVSDLQERRSLIVTEMRGLPTSPLSFPVALPETLSRWTLRPVLAPALDLVIGLGAEDGIAVTYGLGVSQEDVRPTRSAGKMPNVLRRSPLVDQR